MTGGGWGDSKADRAMISIIVVDFCCWVCRDDDSDRFEKSKLEKENLSEIMLWLNHYLTDLHSFCVTRQQKSEN